MFFKEVSYTQQSCIYLIKNTEKLCWGITVKTHGPGMMNKDQESEMLLIKEKFTEENSLQFHQQKSASALAMEFVGRSAYMF